MNEIRKDWNRRQIDAIEDKVDQILLIINGNGKVGLSAKVNIMWQYRGIFIGLFATNLITLLSFLAYVIKINN